MSDIDHVQELRAELAESILTMRERAQIEAELRDVSGNVYIGPMAAAFAQRATRHRTEAKAPS